MKKMPTAAQIKDALHVDVASVKQGVYTVRKGFFYRNGYTEDKLADRVRETYPQATIIDRGEVWKAFRGGATVSQGSHWFVKFTLPKEA